MYSFHKLLSKPISQIHKKTAKLVGYDKNKGRSGGSRKKRGGGNCASGASKRGSKRCSPSTYKLPPPTIEYDDEDISNIIFKIVKAKKEGLSVNQALDYQEKKVYDNYLIQKKEKDAKFKAKKEEQARVAEAASRRKEVARMEETRRQEEALKIEETRRKEAEETAIKKSSKRKTRSKGGAPDKA